MVKPLDVIKTPHWILSGESMILCYLHFVNNALRLCSSSFAVFPPPNTSSPDFMITARSFVAVSVIIFNRSLELIRPMGVPVGDNKSGQIPGGTPVTSQKLQNICSCFGCSFWYDLKTWKGMQLLFCFLKLSSISCTWISTSRRNWGGQISSLKTSGFSAGKSSFNIFHCLMIPIPKMTFSL